MGHRDRPVIHHWSHRVVLLGLAAVLAAVPVVVIAKGGVYTLTKHADPTTGVLRDSAWPRGECGQCHVNHDGAAPNAFVLFAPNTNSLCYTSGCHSGAGATSVYQGPAGYDASSHGTKTSVVWPGADGSVDAAAPAARPSGDWGKCVNCHDPHGYNMDGSGLIPSMTVSREEKLCHVCHDGSPATKNVKADFQKTYVHPVTTSGKHTVAENTPAAFGATPTNNRHAECNDCHNSHIAKADTTLTPPTVSNRILGVSRVSVINGAAGTVPTYAYRTPSDTTPPIAEYEVCFKCHSSWTTQPAGQTDLALRFNANNRSYHPVEAVGKNTNINANAFVNGWTAGKMMYCTDCHTSDNTAVRGAHGSVNRYILKLASTASSAFRTMSSTELCFDCHRFDTYGNSKSSNAIAAYSRFNPPAFNSGHGSHVDGHQVPCYGCHDSHGAANQPTLIVTSRSPGLTTYTQTATGGTCSPTCHGTRTYSNINYAR
jgi:predicted CXXCH cytochrome family protein